LVFEEIFLLKMGDYPPNETVDMIRIVGKAGITPLQHGFIR